MILAGIVLFFGSWFVVSTNISSARIANSVKEGIQGLEFQSNVSSSLPDFQPPPTLTPFPTFTPIPTVTPIPTSNLYVAPTLEYRVENRENFGEARVIENRQIEIECFNFAKYANGEVILVEHHPLSDWFNQLPREKRLEIFRPCEL